MFPVWFMSYRNGDRVAYATVNGQTGKAVADLPVDIRKFIGGSLLLAVPVFILLNLFLTLVHASVLDRSSRGCCDDNLLIHDKKDRCG